MKEKPFDVDEDVTRLLSLADVQHCGAKMDGGT